MSHPSKAWLVLICLFSYFSMGQAGCQTMSQSDATYIRSDIIRLRRDVADIKKQLGAPLPENYQGIMRNQASQREALVELKEGQQRTESRIEETRYELAALRQEIINLKLNLISQMEALRGAGGGTTASPRPFQTPAPISPPPRLPSTDTPKPSAVSTPSPSPDAPKPVQPRRKEPIDYTKLYDTAYEDYQRQNYSLARNGFEEYLRLFPDTDLVDNAQYWIGECYYAEGKYAEAADAFKKVITRYPTGNKVPRAMLKAGHALLQLGKTDEAVAMFKQVIDAYPLSSEADQAKLKLEKIR